MSAWLVSKRHIDCLVTSGIALGLVDESDAHEVGDRFYTENCRSLMARYSDRYESDGGTLPDPHTYAYEPYATEDLFFVHKQIACYRYQSCEHLEWTSSAAHDLTVSMGEKILGILGMTDDEAWLHPLSIAAPWGVRS
jgi:hypothetical protein